MNTDNKSLTKLDVQNYWVQKMTPQDRVEIMTLSNSSQFKKSSAMLNCCYDYMIEHLADEIMTLKLELLELEKDFVATLSPDKIIKFNFPEVTNYDLSTHETRFRLGQVNRPLRVFLSEFYLSDEKWNALSPEQRSYILDIIA